MSEQHPDTIISEAQTVLAPPAEAVPEAKSFEAPDGTGDLCLVVRDGYTVERVEGPKRAKRLHTFHGFKSFAEWLIRHADPCATEILVDASLAPSLATGADEKDLAGIGRAVALLEPTERARHDVVEAILPLHPVFRAWASVLGKTCDQIGLFEHVRSFRDSITAGGEMLVGALGQIAVLSAANATTEIGALGETRLVGGDRKTEANVTVPPEITVRTPIFLDEDADALPRSYGLKILVSMRFVGEGERKAPIFVLRCPTLPVVLAEALRDQRDGLVAALDAVGGEEKFLVGFGRPKTEIVSID